MLKPLGIPLYSSSTGWDSPLSWVELLYYAIALGFFFWWQFRE